MTCRGSWRFAPTLVLLALAGPARAEVKEAAELLPAQTLASVEVRQPERLSREFSALLKDSDLDDMPAAMSRFRERLGDDQQIWSYYEYATMGILVSPEAINEAGRIRGAIAAVTGVNKDGPEVVAVVLSGDSNLPAFMVHVSTVMGLNSRCVTQVEGVRVYRERVQRFEAPAAGQPAQPHWEEQGPYMAVLPEAVVLGSSADAVKDVILRAKGKVSGPSLASVAAYKDAARLRDKPGLFAYADPAALSDRIDQTGADLGPLAAQWRTVKAVVNPKAIRSATASLSLQNGAVELKARLDLDPGQSSPLADLLAAKVGAPDALAFTPRDGMLALDLNLDNGEKRWQKLMELIDSFAKPGPGEPERPAPSAALRAAEDRLKVNIAHDVLGRLAGAAVVVEPTAAGRPVPLLVLQAADADAAKYLEEQGVAKVLGVASLALGAPEGAPAAVHEQVDGRSVGVVAAGALAGLLNAKNVYVGREGAFVVVGADGKEVVAALNAGAKKEGLLGDEKAATALKGLDEPQVVAAVSVGKGYVEWIRNLERNPPRAANFTPVAPNAPAPPPAEGPPKLSSRAEKAIADAAKVVEPLPPTVVGVGRKPDALTLEVRQSGLKAVSAKAIDLWIESGLDRLLEQTKRGGN